MNADLRKALLSPTPEKYGFELCQHCAGFGSSLKEQKQQCSNCAGFGLVKIEDDITPAGTPHFWQE